VLFTYGFEVIMKDKKEPTNEDIKVLIEALAVSFETNLLETADVLKILGKGMKNLGRRLEQLEDHVYNGDDYDDEYLN
tara:strand:- start:128 stop:361 length:234 start_codon:yes stop_codon:yes gene_type:complete